MAYSESGDRDTTTTSYDLGTHTGPQSSFKEIEAYSKEVGTCDGLEPTKTLTWFRVVSRTPCPLEVAKRTACEVLADFFRDNLHGPQNWDLVFQAIAHEFVNSQLEKHQHRALTRLVQKSGEPLVKFIRDLANCTTKLIQNLSGMTQKSRIALLSFSGCRLCCQSCRRMWRQRFGHNDGICKRVC